MDLIGAYENGVGYGNISMRIRGGNQFVMAGDRAGILTFGHDMD